MIPDDLDVFFLKEIYDNHLNGVESNDWVIAKLYACKEGLNKKEEKDNIYRRIKARLINYSEKGLFDMKKNGEGKTIFELNPNLISFGKHKVNGVMKDCIFFPI